MGIEVHVRVRPQKPNEQTAWTTADTVITSVNDNTHHNFSRVYNASSTNATLFHVLEPMIQRVGFEGGRNITIMAYGQTGSGKTHSMMGVRDDPGVVRRTAALLVQFASQTNENAQRSGSNVSTQMTLEMSCIEIYAEKVIDLFTGNEVQLRGGGTDGVTCPSEVQVIKAMDNFEAALALTESRRHVGATDLNKTSSRSHMIITFKITKRCTVKGEEYDAKTTTTSSTINLVDLAGSENAGRAGTAGVSLKEGTAINKSLLSLGLVVNAIASAQQKSGGSVSSNALSGISFRDSNLTRLLQSSLTGKGETFILCCVNPSPLDIEQTRNALEFGKRAMQIQSDPRTTVIMLPPAVTQYLRSGMEEISGIEAEEAMMASTTFYEAYTTLTPMLRNIANKVIKDKAKDCISDLQNVQLMMMAMDHQSSLEHLTELAITAESYRAKTRDIKEKAEKHGRDHNTLLAGETEEYEGNVGATRHVVKALEDCRDKRRRLEEDYRSMQEEAFDVKQQWRECYEEEKRAVLEVASAFLSPELANKVMSGSIERAEWDITDAASLDLEHTQLRKLLSIAQEFDIIQINEDNMRCTIIKEWTSSFFATIEHMTVLFTRELQKLFNMHHNMSKESAVFISMGPLVSWSSCSDLLQQLEERRQIADDETTGFREGMAELKAIGQGRPYGGVTCNNNNTISYNDGNILVSNSDEVGGDSSGEHGIVKRLMARKQELEIISEVEHKSHDNNNNDRVQQSQQLLTPTPRKGKKVTPVGNNNNNNLNNNNLNNNNNNIRSTLCHSSPQRQLQGALSVIESARQKLSQSNSHQISIISSCNTNNKRILCEDEVFIASPDDSENCENPFSPKSRRSPRSNARVLSTSTISPNISHR